MGSTQSTWGATTVPVATIFIRLYLTSQLHSTNTMAGDAHVDESQFKGRSKYFNGVTMRGRANVALATYATIGLIVAFSMRKPKADAKPAAHWGMCNPPCNVTSFL